jgi:hypothetical protein
MARLEHASHHVGIKRPVSAVRFKVLRHPQHRLRRVPLAFRYQLDDATDAQCCLLRSTTLDLPSQPLRADIETLRVRANIPIQSRTGVPTVDYLAGARYVSYTSQK